MPKKKQKKAKTPNLSENAIRILEKRYLKKDQTGNVIEAPKDLFKRVAGNIALSDAK